MNDLFMPQVGAVLSADIAVPEHERELRFYSRVLTTGAQPLWRPDGTNNQGMPIIGLGAQSPQYANMPVQWMPHIQVADVAASVRRALDAGGTELMHAKDPSGNSQWAVMMDPNGASFGLIPVVSADQIPPVDTGSGEAPASVGRIAWLDLTVPNAQVTRDFYRDVVGWGVEDVEIRDGEERYADYNMLSDDGSPAAGVCHARGVNADLPPVWMLYLSVGDIDESIRRVEEEGGSILKAMRGKDGRYAYGAVLDPVGVAFSLVQG
ncbi:MAG TPA: VOC family protein [Rhodothermales bacterium]